MAKGSSFDIPLDQPRFVNGPLSGANTSDLHTPGSGEFTEDALPPTAPTRVRKGDLPQVGVDGGSSWSLHNKGLPWTEGKGGGTEQYPDAPAELPPYTEE